MCVLTIYDTELLKDKIRLDIVYYLMQGRRPKIQIHVITKKRVKDVEKHTTHSNT